MLCSGRFILVESVVAFQNLKIFANKDQFAPDPSKHCKNEEDMFAVKNRENS